MQTLTITVPESLKAFVEAEVAAGHYATADELIGALLSEAAKRKAKERVEVLLLEGLDSGPAIEVTPDYWDEKRRQFDERFGKDADE